MNTDNRPHIEQSNRTPSNEAAHTDHIEEFAAGGMFKADEKRFLGFLHFEQLDNVSMVDFS